MSVVCEEYQTPPNVLACSHTKASTEGEEADTATPEERREAARLFLELSSSSRWAGAMVDGMPALEMLTIVLTSPDMQRTMRERGMADLADYTQRLLLGMREGQAGPHPELQEEEEEEV